MTMIYDVALELISTVLSTVINVNNIERNHIMI